MTSWSGYLVSQIPVSTGMTNCWLLVIIKPMIKCKFENGNEASLRHVCVDAIVLQDNKLLLVKRASTLLEGGKWD